MKHFRWFPAVVVLPLSFLLLLFVHNGLCLPADPLTLDERAWLAEHPVIRVAPDPEYQPLEYFTEKGVYRGITADYLSLIEKRIGIRFQIVRLRNRKEIFDKLRNRQIDVIGAATKTPQRTSYLLFTRPYLEIPLVIIARKKPDRTLTPEQLVGKRVSIVTEHVSGDLISLAFPNIAPTMVPDVRTGLRNVSFGSSDVLLENLLIATFLMEKEGITNLRIAGELGYFYRPSIASRSDWPILNRILEKGLAEISTSEKEVIYKKWVPFESQMMLVSKRARKTVFAGLGLAVLIITGIFGWNRSLSRQVNRKTSELKKELVERERVEKELLRARDELDQRVRERTSDLAETLDALRESEERYRCIIDTANEGIWVVDQDFRFTFVNARMADMIGYEMDELMGRGLESIIFEEDLPYHEKRVEERRGGVSARYERRFRRKDGDTVWALVSVTHHLDSEMRFQGCIAMCIDITGQKRAAEALCFTQFAIDRMLLQAHWMTDDGRLIYVNDAACRALGYTREELLSLSIPEIDPTCPPHVFSEMWREFREKKSVVFESIHRAKDGHVYPVEIQSNYLVFNDKEFNCSFVTDITDRKQAEVELRAARDELESRVRERTSQLTELTEELSRAEERERRRIATELHDQVGQMLALSKIHLNSLSQSLPVGRFEELLGEIREHISLSIHEIRSLTFQLSPPLLYELGLGAALEGLCEEFEEKYAIRVTFRDDGTPELLPVETRIALYQMARELMINVVKHARARRLLVELRAVSGTLEITVEDDGAGFDVSQAMCYTNENKSFGLFSIQHRINHLGGKLVVQSNIGNGSRLTLVTPVREDAELSQ